MNFTNEMKQELQKIIISAVDKEVVLYEDLEFEIPSSISDEFEVTITVEPTLNEIDNDIIEQMFEELDDYTINDISEEMYENRYNSFYDSFEDSHSKNLKDLIRREIEKNEIFENLTVSQLNNFIDSITIGYVVNLSELIQFIYDEMREIIFKEFNNTITLNDLNENDELKAWFKRYRDYMIAGEKPSDLELFDYLEFSSIYDGLKDVFDETDTCSQLMDEIRELDAKNSDLSDYELMKAIFNKHQDVFEKDDELIEMLIDNLELDVLKINNYYVANTYFI